MSMFWQDVVGITISLSILGGVVGSIFWNQMIKPLLTSMNYHYGFVGRWRRTFARHATGGVVGRRGSVPTSPEEIPDSSYVPDEPPPPPSDRDGRSGGRTMDERELAQAPRSETPRLDEIFRNAAARNVMLSGTMSELASLPSGVEPGDLLRITSGVEGDDTFIGTADARASMDTVIKVAARSPGHPDDENCDAFVCTNRDRVEVFESDVDDDGDLVWGARTAPPDGLVGVVCEDTLLVMHVIRRPRMKWALEELARRSNDLFLSKELLDWFEGMPEEDANIVLGLSDVKLTTLRDRRGAPEESAPRRRAIDLG